MVNPEGSVCVCVCVVCSVLWETAPCSKSRLGGQQRSWSCLGHLGWAERLFPSGFLQTRELFPTSTRNLILSSGGLRGYHMLNWPSCFFSRGHICACWPPRSHKLCDQESNRYLLWGWLGGLYKPQNTTLHVWVRPSKLLPSSLQHRVPAGVSVGTWEASVSPRSGCHHLKVLPSRGWLCLFSWVPGGKEQRGCAHWEKQ